MKKAHKDFVKSKHNIIQSGLLTDPEVIAQLEELNSQQFLQQIDSKRVLIKQNSFEINQGSDFDYQLNNSKNFQNNLGIQSNSSILNKNLHTFS